MKHAWLRIVEWACMAALVTLVVLAFVVVGDMDEGRPHKTAEIRNHG